MPGGQITHTSSNDNQRKALTLDGVKVILHKDYLKTITNYYGGNDQEALRFSTSAIEYIRKVPKLLNCEPISLMTALVTAAQLRLLPSGVSSEAYIIPYGNEAKFQIGYQGIVTLLYRTNIVKAISANIIYANDHFEYEEGLDPKLIHRPAMFGKPAGEAIGVYTVVQMEGNARTFKVMDKDAIMGIKSLSKAKSASESPWNSDKDPELWMWKKTCLIQHAKLLPKNSDLQQAIEKDYEGEGTDKPRLDPAGPATAKGSHDPKAKIVEARVVEEEAQAPAEELAELKYPEDDEPGQ